MGELMRFNKKAKKNCLVLFYIALMICCFSFVMQSALAQAEADWDEDKALVVKAQTADSLNENECVDTWNILWTWSKRGNLEARAMLFQNLLPLPGGHLMLMPGHTEDYISRIRDMFIVSTHSAGVDLKDERDNNFHYNRLAMFYQDLPLSKMGGSKVLKCLKDNRSSTCADMAVQSSLIPSFHTYALEIDALLAQGMKPQCLYK